MQLIYGAEAGRSLEGVWSAHLFTPGPPMVPMPHCRLHQLKERKKEMRPWARAKEGNGLQVNLPPRPTAAPAAAAAAAPAEL